MEVKQRLFQSEAEAEWMRIFASFEGFQWRFCIWSVVG